MMRIPDDVQFSFLPPCVDGCYRAGGVPNGSQCQIPEKRDAKETGDALKRHFGRPAKAYTEENRTCRHSPEQRFRNRVTGVTNTSIKSRQHVEWVYLPAFCPGPIGFGCVT